MVSYFRIHPGRRDTMIMMIFWEDVRLTALKLASAVHWEIYFWWYILLVLWITSFSKMQYYFYKVFLLQGSFYPLYLYRGVVYTLLSLFFSSQEFILMRQCQYSSKKPVRFVPKRVAAIFVLHTIRIQSKWCVVKFITSNIY